MPALNEKIKKRSERWGYSREKNLVAVVTTIDGYLQRIPTSSSNNNNNKKYCEIGLDVRIYAFPCS
jgi:hypothetical protein